MRKELCSLNQTHDLAVMNDCRVNLLPDILEKAESRMAKRHPLHKEPKAKYRVTQVKLQKFTKCNTYFQKNGNSLQGTKRLNSTRMRKWIRKNDYVIGRPRRRNS